MPEERSLRRARRGSGRAASPSGAAAAAGRPSTAASSRKKTATRSRPAPTQTSSPEAQSWSSWSGWYAGTRRGSTSDSQSATGSGRPWSGTRASRSVARRSIPCQLGRKRPSVACSAGSTSLRSAASDARRRRRRTSGSHHSRSVPPGRSSPRTSFSSRSSSRRNGSTSRPKCSFASAVVNGPRPFANLWTSCCRAVFVSETSRNASGRPPGGMAPSASRYRPASSAATRRSSPAKRTRIARRSRISVSANPASYSPGPEVAAQPQLVVQLVRVARSAAQLRLDLLERAGVEQLAQLLLSEQLAQQVAVERERLRAPLGRRRVVLVHVGRDVVEEQRGRERRRALRLDVDEVELAGLQAAQDPLQRRQVEDVLQALAVRLEDDRERAVLPRDLEQRLRLQPLLPERRPLARPAARDQQRARGVLAEARAEERRAGELADDELLDLVRVDHQVVGRGRRVRVGKVQRDAVVRPDRLRVERRATRAAARRARAPRARARGLRTASGCTRASRRSRRGSARPRSCGRRGRRRSRRPARSGR